MRSYPNKANGTVFIRNGVIYLLWNGQEISAEAFEAGDIPNDMSVYRIRAIGEQIDSLREEMRDKPYLSDDNSEAFA